MDSTCAFLKGVPLFSGLSEPDLEQLCRMISILQLPAGAELFAEGSLGDKAYIIQSGRIEIYKTANGRSTTLAVRHAGEVIGEMSLLESAPRFATGRAQADSTLFVINHSDLDHLLDASPSAAKALLHTFASRLRSSELLLRQSEKMAQLGTLTAGIAHELNNPAAAAQRGAAQLRESIQRLQAAHLRLGELHLAPEKLAELEDLEQQVRRRAQEPVEMDPLARSDLELELQTWLEARAIPEPWEIAPALVETGFDQPRLEILASSCSGETLSVLLEWLSVTYNAYSLLEEIDQGAARIGEIVKALKSYVYLDQAPLQEIDLHEGINNTLVMLRSRLKSGIHVQREFDPDIPHLMAYGSELNQVWTNLIDNAIQAMGGKGSLSIRTRFLDPWVVVEIEDNGPGIAPEVQPMIFSPFFTTKPVGQGSGMGLPTSYNIIQKHGGDIHFVSRPGFTCFEVRLPVDPEKIQVEEVALPSYAQPDETQLRRILEETQRIAVVGVSSREGTPAKTVPIFLMSKGYQVLPINPHLQEFNGQTVYPDLLSLPEPADLVLIFRRSEAVLPIVEAAIQTGARTIWMQEGVVNLEAAQRAKGEGLQVVMDTCIRNTYKRLFRD